jgi:hypothetical protein
MNDITPTTPDDATSSEGENDPAASNEFTSAADAPEMGFFAEFWDFLVHNKAWWLTPIILVLVLVFVLVWFAGTPFAPFIYGA